MVTLEDIKKIIGEVLQIGDRAENFSRDTELLGSIPEFDSMAVVSILTSIEENLDIFIEDDEVTADVFETVGSLHDFVLAKA